jgi:hypothetical protein
MIFGDTHVFAVECTIEAETPDGWRLGRFRFWIAAVAVGDWEDTVDLKGVQNRMCDFARNERNRFEPLLEHSSAEELFRELYKTVMYEPDDVEEIPPLFYDIRRRFHISHLGMSSFDQVSMILFESATRQRVVWRVAGGAIQEQVLPPGEMQRVAQAFCDWIARQWKKQ